MNSYHALANAYDFFTQDVNYKKWADYLEKHFKRNKIPGNLVLDLACGTGTLTHELARRGYEMIGVDNSPQMLSVATEKGQGAKKNAPIFLCQSMDKLDLYGTVDACVCSLDSINYIQNPAVLQKAFARVHLFLAPSGTFIFDVRTPEFYQKVNGEMFFDETEDAYCVWQAQYEEKKKICRFYMDLFFRETKDLWRRETEVHTQRAYTTASLIHDLEKAGFCHIRQYGNHVLRAPKEGEERVFFVAQRAE